MKLEKLLFVIMVIVISVLPVSVAYGFQSATYNQVQGRVDADITVYDINETEITDWNEIVKTGDSIQYYNQELQGTYKCGMIVPGDVTGDGIINVLDMEAIQKHILKIRQLTGVYRKAGMLDSDEELSVLDMESIQKDILGISKINVSEYGYILETPEKVYLTLEPAVTETEKVVYQIDFSETINEFFGTAGAAVERKTVGGSQALYVSDRNAWWSGARVNLEQVMEAGKSYMISVEFMQDEAEKLDLAFIAGQTVDGKIKEEMVKNYEIKKDTWTSLQGVVVAEESTEDYLFLFERTSGTHNFYVRSITISEIVQDSSEACTYESLCELAAEHGFLMGTLLTQEMLGNNEKLAFAEKNFNIVSCGNYLFISREKTLEADDGMPHADFTECDTYYEYAKAHGMKIRGHAIVPAGSVMDWFFREDYAPDGAYVSAEVVLERLDYYIGEVITHYETLYPGMTVSWDVVNEMYVWLECDIFYEYFGEEMWEIVYGIADKYTDTPLFYNDFCMFAGSKCDAICAIADRLNANGMVLDGIGMESYYAASDMTAITDRTGRDSLYRTALQYHEHGLDVHLSEATLKNYDNSEEGNAILEQAFRDFYQVIVDVNKEETVISVVCQWGWLDLPFLMEGEYSYGLAGTYCGILDYKYGVKPSLSAIIETLK